MLEIKTVGVIGAGTMGSGIAHAFARKGFQVLLHDVEQRFVDRGLSAVKANLDREIGKGKTTADQAQATLQSMRGTLDRGLLAECGLVIEAAPERFLVKQEIFQALDRILQPQAILASNTSSISITRLAAQTKRPNQVIGMHFFNPVPVMKLVEIVRGLETGEEVFLRVKMIAEQLDKAPVEVNDSPGFISNRVLMPLLNEAMFAVMEGVAVPQAVDDVFKLGMAHPMGPLALADFIGLDVCLDIMRVLQESLGDPKYRPCPLLIRMVDAGWLGRKSGRGFYQY